MSKHTWPLATVLMIVPLAASCGRPSLEQGLVHDEPPTVATSGISLADLVAMARQVKYFHRMQQLAALRQQEAEVVAVAYPLPEKQEQGLRALLNEQTVALLQQQLLQAGHRLNNGFRIAAGQALGAAQRFHDTMLNPYQDAMPPDDGQTEAEDPAVEAEVPPLEEFTDPESDTEVSPSDEPAPSVLSLPLDPLAIRRTVLQVPVHRLGQRLASFRNSVGCGWVRFSREGRLSGGWRLRSDSSRRLLNRCPVKSARRPVCRMRLRRR